ncbi:MAG: transposase [Oscillospiraceae bacterium]|nr:transposase [Oscillospiraceae bacterium]MCL2278911.1 transposase [Oscillospiraceae bacterium]
MFRDDFKFKRVAIPINPRGTKYDNSEFDGNGNPVCPLDKTPFNFLGFSGGKGRSDRFKWVCHKSVHKSNSRINTCETPCTDSSYGRCIHTYPDKDFRLYPGIPRGTEHWDNLYRHRVLVERTIYLLKDPLGADSRKSFSSRTAKAELLMDSITQLVGVIIAKAINKPKLIKSIRRLATY